jgi:hypothetical protein
MNSRQLMSCEMLAATVKKTRAAIHKASKREVEARRLPRSRERRCLEGACGPGAGFAMKILVALLVLGAAHAQGAVSRTTFRGTVTTTDGSTGSFRARTFLRSVLGDAGSVSGGRYRCYGRGCPRHHGYFEIIVPEGTLALPDRITTISFGHGSLYCLFSNDDPPADSVIDGAYVCFLPDGTTPFIHGTLHLVPVRHRKSR